jgi:hypothetical protein
LWDDLTPSPVADSVQKQRQDREKIARDTMTKWLAGTWADIRVDANWHYLTGRKRMQEDGWSCGLQMLETLRVILEAGGKKDALLDMYAQDHPLTPDAIEVWKTRFAGYGGV